MCLRVYLLVHVVFMHFISVIMDVPPSRALAVCALAVRALVGSTKVVQATSIGDQKGPARPEALWRSPLELIRCPFEIVGQSFASPLHNLQTLKDRLEAAPDDLVYANAVAKGAMSVQACLARDMTRHGQATYIKEAEAILVHKIVQKEAEERQRLDELRVDENEEKEEPGEGSRRSGKDRKERGRRKKRDKEKKSKSRSKSSKSRTRSKRSMTPGRSTS